jgi:hypothetical protein
VTFAAFLYLHKVEDNVTEFFEVLSNEVTGIAVPEVTPGLVLALLVLPIGAWLAAPFLIRRGSTRGYFLGWTFFCFHGNHRTGPFHLPGARQ